MAELLTGLLTLALTSLFRKQKHKPDCIICISRLELRFFEYIFYIPCKPAKKITDRVDRASTTEGD